ncbi:hypothetical protein GCM10027432_12760 [Lysobacter fragariae]
MVINEATFNQGTGVNTPAKKPDTATPNRPGTYIVVYNDDALATYQGTIAGLAAPSRKTVATGKYKLDTHSADARRYVGYLQRVQVRMEQAISRAVLHRVPVRARMQHAINGIIADLTPAEARIVAELGNVRLVEPYREYAVDTDVGPALIGAPTAWAGSVGEYYNSASPVQGEGVVVGIIDTGINFGSPSFAATDPIDGYVHVNPLGAGTYLGTCASGGVDDGRCNSKLIGGYDYVCGAPTNACTTAGLREEPGFGDTNSHGSHTASTTAGNHRDAMFASAMRRISGVAPRANIIAYDVCYTTISTGQGSCPNTATVSAVNQAIADGIVDVINYSISGGNEPWTDATSLAFLNAVDAGIYVAASAGNSGPGPNTLGHLEPWVASTAAAQHGRGGFSSLLNVTGPAPVPAGLQPLILTNGTGGVDITVALPGTTPLKVSAGIDTTTDGCAAFAAGEFTGAIAVIRRGGCTFAVKANNATAAGAVAVVIANNTAGAILPSVPGTTVPVFSVLQSEGDTIRNFVVANPTATASIGLPVALPNTPDVLGSFSSRGPAGRFDLVKPDITAPGVNVLAVIAGTTVTGSENLIGLMSGTSMASPHHAGAAALVREARPTWTMPEIKSALMMTATPTVYTEDSVTLANPFARGAGRIRVDRAIRAGLVLNETTANFTAANPDSAGNPTTLNLPSLGNGKCFPTCTFVRTFRNPGTTIGLWRISMSGVPGTVSPSLMWVLPGLTRSVTFTVNAAGLPADGSWSFGQVLMEYRESGGRVNDYAALRLPIAVSVPAPIVSVPSLVNATATAGAGTASFNIGNIGGSTLNYVVSNSGNGVVAPYTADSTGVSSGFRSIIYTDPATAGNNAQFSGDDFTVTETTNISSLKTEGFVVSGAALTAAAVNITWSLYPDAGGVPAGNPQSNPGAAVWSYTAAPTAAGVSIGTSANGSGSSITLNLATAGQNVALPPGTYWLVVSTRGTFANRWAHFGSNTGNGSFASITVSTSNVGSWASNTAFSGLSMVIKGTVACGAPWLGAAVPASGALAPAASQLTLVGLNSGGMAAGSYRANVCVSSNDPVTPVAAVPIVMTAN